MTYNVLQMHTRDGYPLLYNRFDKWIGESITHYGEFSELECAFIRAILRPGDVALNIGANIGTLAIAMSEAVGPEGVVCAFEPQRILHQVLCANLALRSIENVRTFHAAVGNQRGQLNMPMLAYDAENSFGGLSLDPDAPKPGDVPTEKVQVAPLDDLALVRCDLLQADVEGMELDVLKGAAHTIASHHPLLYIEADRAHKRHALHDYLTSIGYTAYWHTPALFNPGNVAGNPENRFLDPQGLPVVSINWFAVHPARPIPLNDTWERARVTDPSGYLPA